MGITITEQDLIYCIAGQLYRQAPNGEPRNADLIMSKVKRKFRENAENYNEFYFIDLEPEATIMKYLTNLLMGIEEFKDLNLSQVEVENNVEVEDPNRSKFGFVSSMDKYDANSWKFDFIDLDAFIRSVCNELTKKINNNKLL
jgi:hypothetical protein